MSEVLARMADAYWQTKLDWYRTKDGVLFPPQMVNEKALRGMRRALEALRVLDPRDTYAVAAAMGYSTEHVGEVWGAAAAARVRDGGDMSKDWLRALGEPRGDESLGAAIAWARREAAHPGSLLDLLAAAAERDFLRQRGIEDRTAALEKWPAEQSGSLSPGEQAICARLDRVFRVLSRRLR